MKTIRNEILVLVALAAAEWFDVIHYFFALLISLTILCAIAITCIVFLFKKKFRLLGYLVALTTIVMSVTYLMGIDIPPYFHKDLWKDSITMQESIDDKAFICQYKILDSVPYNKYGIKAKEIFAEKRHWYKSEFSRFYKYNDSISNLYLMVENAEEIKERGFEKKWELEKFYGGIRCRGICQFELTTRCDPKDTILVRVVDYHKGTPLDTLFLVKVKTEK